MTDPLQAAIAAAVRTYAQIELDRHQAHVTMLERQLARVQDLLKTWKTNRSSPRYGTGSPGPLYTAGMSFAADSCIAGLAAALGEKP